MAVGRVVRGVVATVAAVVLVSCTAGAPEEAPSPTPTAGQAADPEPAATGDRVAIIVPPAGVVAAGEGAALARAARDLAEDLPSGVADVRVVEAASSAFARDLAELAADDGYDVVCLVGTGAAELALAFARDRRDVRVCTTDPRIAGGPVNVVAAGVDPAVLVEAGAAAVGAAPAPVGLLLAGQLGDVEALASNFVAAVEPPRQVPAAPQRTSPAPTPSPTVAPSPAPPPQPAAERPPFVTLTGATTPAAQLAAGEQLAAGSPSRALVLVTPGGAATARAAAAAGAALVVVNDWAVNAEGELPPNLLVGLTVDWGELLRAAVDSARMEDAPQVQLLGVPAGVVGALPGQAQGAVPATERAMALLGPVDEE